MSFECEACRPKGCACFWVKSWGPCETCGEVGGTVDCDCEREQEEE